MSLQSKILLKLSLICVMFTNIAAFAQPILFAQNGAVTALDIPLIIAKEKGMFEKRNLDVGNYIQFGNTATTMVAVSTGQVQFTNISMYTIIQAHYNLPVVLLARPIAAASALLYSVNNIKKVSDLKGKTVAVGGNNDSTRMYAEIILRNEGIDPDKDIKWFYSGDSSLRLSSMQSGLIDGAILMPPYNFIADKSGLNKLSLTTNIKNVVHKSLVFNSDWALSNTEKVKLITEAIDESINWLYDIKNRNEAIAILSKVSNISMDESSIAFDWVIAQKSYIIEPEIKRSMVEDFVKTGKNWGTIPMEKNIPIEKIVVTTAKIID